MAETDIFGWIGSTIDQKYAIEALAGEGAFGRVYRAKHLGFGEPVAVKCLGFPGTLTPGQRDAFLSSFVTEARLLHRLSRCTTGIVQALDVGAAVSPSGVWTPYIVMEWLEGKSLDADLVDRRSRGLPPYPLDDAMALLASAAEALDIAHQQGVSHRDVKPSNLLVVRTGDQQSLKVVDFGIAKVIDDAASAPGARSRTLGGLRAFTPRYGAPEQFRVQHGATGPWTDVFAFALVVLELVTGEPALPGRDEIELYAAAISARDRLKRPSVALPEGVLRVLEVALDPAPVQRYRTLGAFWSALEEAHRVSDAVSARTPRGKSASDEPSASSSPMDGEARLGGAARPDGSANQGGARRSNLEVTATQLAGDATLPAEVGAGAPPSVSPGENRVCTVMFAEVSGLATAEAPDAETIRDTVSRCHRALTECIEAGGGQVGTLLDGCVMAVFGLPYASETDAERAVESAMELQEIVGRLSPPRRAAAGQRLTLRVGLNTGRVFVGVVGAARQPTVIGEAVGVASRLRDQAPPGTVLVGRDTYRQVVGRYHMERLPRALAPSSRETDAAFRVLGPVAFRNVLPPTDFHGLETRFVGRRAEMHRIEEALASVIAERRAHVVTVVGDPGVGRSRILTEAWSALLTRRERFFVLSAASSPLHVGTSYALVNSLLQARFAIGEHESPEVVQRQLLAGVHDWWTAGTTAEQAAGPPIDEEELADVVRRIAPVLAGRAQGRRSASSDPSTPDESGPDAKRRISAAWVRFVGIIASRTPVVILCDDVHWADDASLDVLNDLGSSLSEQPAFVLCTARAAELYDRRPHWGEGSAVHTRVDVGKLQGRYTAELIRDRLRCSRDVSPEFVQRLAERADDNPLVLEEMLHLLVDTGVIEVRAEDAWTVHEDRLGTRALPATIQGVVQARLDRLDTDARATLAEAAVVGRTFWQSAVERLRPTKRTRATEEILALLRQRRLIRIRETSTLPGEREYVFAESAVQEVAYETLSFRVRRSLHRLVAEWIQQRASGPAQSALRALHLDRGGDPRNAAEEYARAAAYAAALGQNDEALRHFERARRIHEVPPPPSGDKDDDLRVAAWRERTRLRLDQGDVLRRAGRLDDAERAYEDARQSIVRLERRRRGARDADRPDAAPADAKGASPQSDSEAARWDARIDLRLAMAKKVRGDTAEARALVERAIAGATTAGAPEDTPMMWALLATLRRRDGDVDGCREACLRGLRACRHIRSRTDSWREASSNLLISLGAVFYVRRQWIRAERCYRQAVRAADDKERPEAARFALNDVAVVRYAQGDVAGARDVLQRVLALNERAGDLLEVAIVRNNLAEAELRLGRSAVAREHAECAVRTLERLGAHADLPDALRNLAEALFADGAIVGALDAGLRALSLAERAAGQVYLGDVALALSRICRAVELAPGGAEERAALARARGALLASLANHFTTEALAIRARECTALLLPQTELKGADNANKGTLGARRE